MGERLLDRLRFINKVTVNEEKLRKYVEGEYIGERASQVITLERKKRFGIRLRSVIGTAEILVDPSIGYAFIRNEITVDTKYRGEGHGTAIFHRLIKEAQRRGAIVFTGDITNPRMVTIRENTFKSNIYKYDDSEEEMSPEKAKEITTNGGMVHVLSRNPKR